ncbi:hypothetical protein ACFQS3_07190 [Glycomyces mayteni]|uniref:Uncharacterized protein n=1 Tax=Glycomyces mayteni TaxID=543887 RepID=A0ABW2D756_9ACTN
MPAIAPQPVTVRHSRTTSIATTAAGAALLAAWAVVLFNDR